jgi:glycosyltransferase involved in cell wall biosynthesis
MDQSYKNVEIIVIDDGSRDNTKEVLKEFMNDIKYINQENRGLPGARNRGLQEATGDYIAFLDADDYWEPDKLEIQMNVLESLPAVSVVFSDFSVFNEDGYHEKSYFYKNFPFFKEYGFRLGDIFDNVTEIPASHDAIKTSIYYGNIIKHLFCGNFILPSSVVMRKSSIDLLGGFNDKYKIAEETEFFLRICTKYDAAYVDCPLVHYLIKRPGNLTGSSNIERLIKNAIDIQENYLSMHPDVYERNRSLFKKAISITHNRLAYYYLTVTMKESARKEATISIRWRPFQASGYSYWIISYFPTILLSAGGWMKRNLMPANNKKTRSS